MKLHVQAKCSDMFSCTLTNGDKSVDYHGYVPSWMPGNHYGDYVSLEIDADTGHILNWKSVSFEDVTEEG